MHEPYDSSRNYTIDEMEALWHLQDSEAVYSAQALTHYMTLLFRLYPQDPVSTISRLKGIAYSLFDGVLSGKINSECGQAKEWRLRDFCIDNRLANLASSDPEMQYIIATLIMYCAVRGDHAIVGATMASVYLDTLNPHIRSILDIDENVYFQLKHTPEMRPSQQLARELFSPAWCALVEPDLMTLKATVEAVWGQRPQLIIKGAPLRQSQAMLVTGAELPDMYTEQSSQ